MFLMDSEFQTADFFLNELWLMRLAYLADIFGKLNDLNSSLQGRNITPFVVVDKINAIIKKLQFIVSDVEQFQVTAFQSLQTFLTENELRLHPDMVEDIKKHCTQLILNFQTYFPEQFDDKSWIRNSFSEVALPANFSVEERDQFIELSCDGGLKSKFNKDFLSDFWLKIRSEYGFISDRF
jgi:zinc finger BED domain-containing protein 5/7/8/9